VAKKLNYPSTKIDQTPSMTLVFHFEGRRIIRRKAAQSAIGRRIVSRDKYAIASNAPQWPGPQAFVEREHQSLNAKST
jgi:hypothetical protein